MTNAGLAPPHRLRDLDRRQAVVAAALVAMLLVPFGVSLWQARAVEWLPSGDDALIGLRSLDAFGDHSPLIGQPSTSHLYGPEEGTAHPGPIEFYWLAAPVRVFGAAAGMLLGSLAINMASVLVAAWVVLRRAGPAVAAWASVLLTLVLWSQGTALLTDPISSNAGSIPLVALGAIAWALLDGDLRLLPLGALVGSWVAQQHLAIGIPAATLVLLGTVGATVHAWRRWRAVDAGEEAQVEEDEAAPKVGERSWPWVLGALALVAVLWSPVLWQQATGDPGNISAVVEYSQRSETPSIGPRAGLRQVVRAMGAPPLLARSDLAGDDLFEGPVLPYEVAVAVLAYGALAATAIVGWRHRRTLSLLAGTALVLTAGGLVNGAKIPDSVEAFRIAFYRWAFVVAWLAWTALGWAAVLAVRAFAEQRGRELPAWPRRIAPVAALAVAIVPTLATLLSAPGIDDERRDEAGFPMMRELSAAALDATEPGDRVTLVLRGGSANLSTGPALAMQLEAAGREVVIPGQEARFYGEHRILEPGGDPGDVVLLLQTGEGDLPPAPGERLASVALNARLEELQDALAEQGRSADPVPSDRAEELLDAAYDPPGDAYVRDVLLPDLGNRIERILIDPVLIQLLIDGYFDEPQFDRSQLEQLRDELPVDNVNLDDRFELRLLTEDDLAEVAPAWKEGAP